MFRLGDGPARGSRTVRRSTLDLFWLDSLFHFGPLGLAILDVDVRYLSFFMQSGRNGILIATVLFWNRFQVT